MPHSVTDDQFSAEVLNSPVPVLVDFWAPWCGPCKAMNPVLEALEPAYEGKAKVVKVNVDENITTAGQYNVLSIPTFMIFKKGKAVATIVGARPKEDLARELDAALA